MFEHGHGELKIKDINVKGTKNAKQGSFDKTVLSIYKIGGSDQHYTRMRDVIIDYTPVMSDLRFYISHEANAAYFLAKKDDKQYIIVVHLGSLKWKKYDITYMGKLNNLRTASLIKANTTLVLCDPTWAKKVRDAKKKKSTEHIPKEWLFYDLKTGNRDWSIPHAEAVFFKGADSGKEIDIEADLDQEENDTEGGEEVYFMDTSIEVNVEHKLEKKFWRLKKAERGCSHDDLKEAEVVYESVTEKKVTGGKKKLEDLKKTEEAANNEAPE
mmetsp:Transcript_113475/g.156852  ORF Transcript_113475/g.156852 Transcript_113475/m.156852 type:complete len:270 (+) Transcript_113475:256-1065(+)